MVSDAADTCDHMPAYGYQCNRHMNRTHNLNTERRIASRTEVIALKRHNTIVKVVNENSLRTATYFYTVRLPLSPPSALPATATAAIRTAKHTFSNAADTHACDHIPPPPPSGRRCCPQATAAFWCFPCCIPRRRHQCKPSFLQKC
jgi:hypothetical protein